MTIEYAGHYIYNKVSGRGVSVNLKFFNHPKSYLETSSGAFDYVYQYKDHFDGGVLI
ncbi:hypothetical protein TPENAI_60305 [Tenacibaculum litopenaei]|uniref:hypothetical protein n=1 Tax=Tenacibaculum litopenaei TaxID=396016 RepID=UPI003894BF42